MIALKNKYIKTIPCLLILFIFVSIQFKNVKAYYDEILNNSGLVYDNFVKNLKEENKKAIESEEEYKRILQSEELKEEESQSSKEDTENIEVPNLHALSSLLMDARNNRVLYEDNGYKKMPMASTTKIMTCIIALENADLSETVTISSYAARQPDVQLNVREGEKYYLKDLLYSLMLESHNDVAVAIAEHVGGSVEGFATMMNDKARDLGCEDTNFVTPNGLDAEGHYTTARDLAVIASYAIKNDQFISITNTASHSFSELQKGRGHRVSNKNKFLYMMDGAIGVKTGFTGGAGYCFVGAIKRTDRTLVSVVLGCGWPPNKSLKWSETKKLMSFGLKYFNIRQIFEEVDLDPVFVNDGQQKYVKLSLQGNLTLLMRDDEKVRVEYDIPKQLQAPVKADSVVGKASYYINDVFYEDIPIYTTQDIKKIDYGFCFNKLLKIWSLQ